MDAPGLTIRLKLQDTSGNVVYTGDPARSLRLWGATFELGRIADRNFGDFTDQYHYIRSLGSPGDWTTIRYLYDTRSELVTVGGISPIKVTYTGDDPNERIAFDYIKVAKRGGNAGLDQNPDSIQPSDQVDVQLNP